MYSFKMYILLENSAKILMTQTAFIFIQMRSRMRTPLTSKTTTSVYK